MARIVLITLSVLLGISAAKAADWSEQLSRAVELPAHRWLAELRAAGREPAKFETDGCSGGMSTFWTFLAEHYPAFSVAHGGVPPWESCCITHDQAYHKAGPDPAPEASYDERLAADEALRQCVQATSSIRDTVLMEEYGMSAAQVRGAYAAISEAMFQAVRLGGGPCTGLPWRWGYGYPHCWQRSAE